MKYVVIGLFALFLLVWYSIPSLLSYLLYRWLKKKGYKKLGQSIIIVVTISMIYLVYTAFYPTDGFYEDEFERITKLEFPESGEILTKYASYPDLHGDYFSNAVFRVDSNDFNEILTKIESNVNFERFTPTPVGLIYKQDKPELKNNIVFTHSFLINSDRSDIRFFISFDKQNKLIEFNRSSW
ncbi:MAG: hypothetical protein PF588_10030 [Candidatus Kapabacteria bacterium]|jgi:hypothetical protein|nr:hypothetical protein [Candidatus Kapabacteria bacterium]